jgi:hypothetical protein
MTASVTPRELQWSQFSQALQAPLCMLHTKLSQQGKRFSGMVHASELCSSETSGNEPTPIIVSPLLLKRTLSSKLFGHLGHTWCETHA